MYKHQPIDTIQLFNLARRIFTIAERLDSIDMKPDKKGRVSPDYRKDNAQRLLGYRPNLFFGGASHLRRGDFQKAFDFFEMYIDCARQPLFTNDDLLNTDPRIGEAAYWATYSGYRMNDPVLTLRHHELARRDTTKLEYTLQYAAEAWNRLGDNTRYGELLWEGFAFFPQSPYFFPRLMDDYTRKGNNEQALMVVDEALKTDSLNELYLFAKSSILLNLGRYAESLDYSKRLLTVNDQMADAYYNAGTACLNIILNMDSRRHKKQIRKMYQKAQPYMETYRQLAPEAKDKWGPALYRIYFNLNLGKQFDEIDKILKN
jgi:tetratricopeptide (TPR) repeat protein